MVACVALVLAFKSSSSLAAAYGIAVTGTMAITSFLYFLVCRRNWNYSLGRGARAVHSVHRRSTSRSSRRTSIKIAAGGWFPLAVGAGVFVDHDDVVARPLRAVEDDGDRHDPRRAVPRGHRGDAAAARARAPRCSWRRAPTACRTCCSTTSSTTRCCTSRSCCSRSSPRTCRSPSATSALTVRELGHGFYRVHRARRLHAAAERAARSSRAARSTASSSTPADTTYYLGRQTLLTTRQVARWRAWRKMLFSFLARNARPPTVVLQPAAEPRRRARPADRACEYERALDLGTVP